MPVRLLNTCGLCCCQICSAAFASDFNCSQRVQWWLQLNSFVKFLILPSFLLFLCSMTLTSLADQKWEKTCMCYMFVFKNIWCFPPFVWNTHEDFAASPTWRVTVAQWCLVSWNIPISMVILTKKNRKYIYLLFLLPDTESWPHTCWRETGKSS